MVNAEINAMVDAVVVHEKSEGYVTVLRSLAFLMGNNPSKQSQKAGELVESLAAVLDEYLEDEEDDDYESA